MAKGLMWVFQHSNTPTLQYSGSITFKNLELFLNFPMVIPSINNEIFMLNLSIERAIINNRLDRAFI
jgi:hypothetical protein